MRHATRGGLPLPPIGFLIAAVLLLAAASPGAAASAAFPVVMRDARGVSVRLARPPARVVSLAPSITEIVYLLGQEGRLAGVTRFCNFPPQAESLPRVGGVTDPDIERIVAARPDLVLCTVDGNPRERVRVVEETGIPVFAIGPQDLAGIFAAIEQVGALLGVPGKARSEAAALRARASRVSRAARHARGPSPRVLFVVSTSPVIAAGKETFLDELVRAGGGRNAASGYAGRYPRLSVEDLLALRPDVILVAAMAGVERFPPEVTRWTEVPAFRDGEVVSLDGDLVTRPGPRMVSALEKVTGVLSAWRARRVGASPAGGRGR